MLERADQLIRKVKDDPNVSAENKHDLDYGLMLLLHHRTRLGEEAPRVTQSQKQALSDFQEWMFENWQWLESMPLEHRQVISSKPMLELTSQWPIRLRVEKLFDIASCLSSLLQCYQYTAFKDRKLVLSQTWSTINLIVTQRLRLPMLQIPYYCVLQNE